MTAFCVLNLLEKFGSSSIYAQLTTSIRILRPVSRIIGTSANLLEGDMLTIHELMYGMMLPSGNDAAVALGVHFGGLLMSAGTKNPIIEISENQIIRRVRAQKIVSAKNYLLEQQNKAMKQKIQLINMSEDLKNF